MPAYKTAMVWQATSAALRMAAMVVACTAIVPMAALAGCDWGDIAVEGVQAASIRAGAPRVYFVQHTALRSGCPNDSAGCQARAYLTPNDIMLTGPSQAMRSTAAAGWLFLQKLKPPLPA